MSPEQIKAAVRHEFEELNKGKAAYMACVDDNYAPGVVTHFLAFGMDMKGLKEFKQAVSGLFNSFPDIHEAIDDVVVERDKAAIRYTWTGTNNGMDGNIAPTGKKVTQTAFLFQRYESGKMAEQWWMENRLSYYQQLRVAPTADMK